MVNHYRATVYKTVNYDGKKWALNHPGDSETPVGTLAEVAEHYLAYLKAQGVRRNFCLLYTSPSPRDAHESRMPSSA